MASAAFRVQASAIVLSVALHGVVSWALSYGSVRLHPSSPTISAVRPGPPDSAAGASGSPERDVEVDLPLASAAMTVDDVRDPTGSPPLPAGGEAIARIDTPEQGRGGERQVAESAIDLADRDERLRLSPDLLSRLDRDQIQRLRVARDRQSWDDRRATLHPSELSFVLSGTGTVRERRVDAPTLPGRGELQSPMASAPGRAVGDATPVDAPGRTGSNVRGTREQAPGTGIVTTRAGTDHRASAPIANERPAVTEGPVAVPARDLGLPRDDTDSEQEVATTVQSLVHASTAGGLLGIGVGGTGGTGEPGAGGIFGSGSHSRPLGFGDSDVFDYWTTDPRLMPYFRQMHAKIEPLWANAFPKSALLDLKQGTVILEFTIASDGRISVSWPPTRPSGIDEFDRNCADAVRRASPLLPIPRELGMRSLRVRAPFVASNPIIK